MIKVMRDPDWIYITAGDVHSNIRIHGILEKIIAEVHLDPTPEWISADCGIVVKIRSAEEARARSVLAEKGVSGFRLF